MKNKTLPKVCVCCLLLLAALGTVGCAAEKKPEAQVKSVNYREEMVVLIEELRGYAKIQNPSFELLANNGIDLFLEEDGGGNSLSARLLRGLDGVLVESYHYGWDMNDDEKTPAAAQREFSAALRAPFAGGLPVFNIDYCAEPSKVRRAYALGKKQGFVQLAASRQLDAVPRYPKNIHDENAADIQNLKDVRNFLALLNPEHFRSKQAYIDALSKTNYDLLFIDLTFNGEAISREEINRLKKKSNGGRRLVFCYISVGEAEDYRPYWRQEWHDEPPRWIAEENPDWEGNFKVKYWTKEWKRVLFGAPDSCVDLALQAGFDGVFMDVIDAFEYFERGK